MPYPLYNPIYFLFKLFQVMQYQKTINDLTLESRQGQTIKNHKTESLKPKWMLRLMKIERVKRIFDIFTTLSCEGWTFG
jgi:hypothetical protein